MSFALGQPRSGNLKRDRPADDLARALPQWTDAIGRALQAQRIERVGYVCGRKPQQPLAILGIEFGHGILVPELLLMVYTCPLDCHPETERRNPPADATTASARGTPACSGCHFKCQAEVTFTIPASASTSTMSPSLIAAIGSQSHLSTIGISEMMQPIAVTCSTLRLIMAHGPTPLLTA